MTQPGASAQHTYQVTDADTAASLGSGDLAVLGTPRLLAWCEQQTVAAVAADLAPGSSSVGAEVSIEHLRPSQVGASVHVTAWLVHIDDRRYRFEVVANDDSGDVVGRGEIIRVVVDADRFMSRLPRRSGFDVDP